MKYSEVKNLKEGDKIQVKSDSYTAFNGQSGVFIRLTEIDKEYGQLAMIHIDSNTIINLPIETFEKYA